MNDIVFPDIDFAKDDLPNLHEVLKSIRPYGSVVKVNYGGSPTWLVLDHDDVSSSLMDVENFDTPDGHRIIAEPSMGRNLQTVDRQEHRIQRALVTSMFLPKTVRGYIEALIEPTAREVAARMEGMDEVEFVSAFARPFPFRVITRLLDIPVTDEDLLLDWAVKLISFPFGREAALKARHDFDEYMEGIVDEHRRKPGDDFVSTMLAAEFEGRKLSDEEILSFCRLLFPAGSDTAYKNGSSLFAYVLQNPDVRELSKRGAAEREAIVAEGLRFEPPVALQIRMATGTKVVNGVEIKKGDWVLFSLASANRDPAVFNNPDTFDPGRDNRALISFGKGAHFCLGMHLARRELETALKVVFEMFPKMSIKPGFEIEFYSAILRGPRALLVNPYGREVN